MQWQKEKNRWTICKKSLPGDHYGCQSTSYRLHYYLFSSYYNCKYKHKNYFSFESIFKIVKQKKKKCSSEIWAAVAEHRQTVRYFANFQTKKKKRICNTNNV